MKKEDIEKIASLDEVTTGKVIIELCSWGFRLKAKKVDNGELKQTQIIIPFHVVEQAKDPRMIFELEIKEMLQALEKEPKNGCR